MTTTPMSEVIQHLRRIVLLRDESGLTDGQLLGCFIEHGDEAAFAALVKRHGPMVWGVCRRLLNPHDAEDAFQATFLVLVRKATSILPREMVGNWLYGVAHQTALQARRKTARRRAREKQMTEMPEPAVMKQDLWSDLHPLLDEELSRLPDKYRVVIVLCDLEGKTRKEAARQLGVPEGTIASRIATARTMLAKRLAKHGLAVSGEVLAAVLTDRAASAGVPSSVVSSTIKAASLLAAGNAATGIVSIKVAALTEGVLKTMLLNKLKVATVTLLLLVVLGGGVVGLTHRSKVVAQAETPKQVSAKQTIPTQNGEQGPIDRKTAIQKEKQHLQGLWEDCEIDGDTYHFDGNIIEYRSKRISADYKWSYRIDLPQTKPPAIDIFTHIDTGPGGTGRGVYELDGDNLTIVYADPRKERATKFERGGGNTLLVLKRVKEVTQSETPGSMDKEKEAMDKPLLVVHAVLEKVDADNSAITAKCVGGDSAVSVQRLLSLVVSDERPATADEIEKVTKWAYRVIAKSSNDFPKLVDVPVRSDAKIMRGKTPLKLKDLQPGRVIALQLATDRTTGIVIVGIRVVDKHADKKP